MHLGHPLENTALVFLSTCPKHGVGFINKGSCASENLGSMAPVNGGCAIEDSGASTKGFHRELSMSLLAATLKEY